MPVTSQTFERLALEDPERHWELHRGRLRPQPATSFAHNETVSRLARQVVTQVDHVGETVRIHCGYLKRTDASYYMPDLFLMPVNLPRQKWDSETAFCALEAYEEPVLFVAEVWSPPIGDFDDDAKLPEYQARGDLEIWRIHPYDRTLALWRRRPDGEYDEAVFRTGRLALAAVPGVTIDLDALFAR